MDPSPATDDIEASRAELFKNDEAADEAAVYADTTAPEDPEYLEHPAGDLRITFSPEKFSETVHFDHGVDFSHIVTTIAEAYPAYDWTKCKALISGIKNQQPKPKTLLKCPDDDHVLMAPYASATLKLITPSISALASLQSGQAAAAAMSARNKRQRRQARISALPIRGGRPNNIAGFGSGSSSAQADAAYTFHTLRPLPHLPHPERSTAYLERLKADPGIRAAMRKHRFSVGLLTEMDPMEYTASTHEGTTRVLGLNRNQGEVIELRLRTDAFDGYRDYKTIRKTLCHELAHNVHGPHDRNFWDLRS
ncbi:WLM domain-containing protein [Bombardia bombarda]|uniref:WLM domain-containing protein n=1 Tax=Bombardia bombarda TaxID=252184 RepID=A0AA39XJ22_9PEZI|nr:WLM domain-containing protein [Bombardia bombarda]